MEIIQNIKESIFEFVNRNSTNIDINLTSRKSKNIIQNTLDSIYWVLDDKTWTINNRSSAEIRFNYLCENINSLTEEQIIRLNKSWFFYWINLVNIFSLLRMYKTKNLPNNIEIFIKLWIIKNYEIEKFIELLINEEFYIKKNLFKIEKFDHISESIQILAIKKWYTNLIFDHWENFKYYKDKFKEVDIYTEYYNAIIYWIWSKYTKHLFSKLGISKNHTPINEVNCDDHCCYCV